MRVGISFHIILYFIPPLFFLRKDGMSKSCEFGLVLSPDVGTDVIFLSQTLDTIWSTPILDNGLSLSNPVAITVITISSSKDSSIDVPKMIFASGSTLLCTSSAAVLISCNPTLLEPVILMITPLAPSIDVSRSGLWIACFAASSALFSPVALPNSHMSHSCI